MILDNNINYRSLGHFKTESILRKIESSDLDWDSYNFRQSRYKDHSETKTIPIIWSEKFSGIEKHEPYYSIFEKEIKEVDEFLRNNFYNHGNIVTAILINLPPGKSIGRHKDGNPIGDRFNRCHRIHIPISTNDKCFFEIEGEIKNMKVNEVWEISNVNKRHSVSNWGETDRIHLLIDWDPK